MEPKTGTGLFEQIKSRGNVFNYDLEDMLESMLREFPVKEIEKHPRKEWTKI